MKIRHIVAIIVSTLSSVALAAPPKVVERNLKRHYGDAKVEITGTRTINDVTVYDAKIVADAGTSKATITETGDFILAGKPMREDRVPGNVSSALKGLIKANASEAEQYAATEYHVRVEAAGRLYTIEIDPLGRVRDIITQRELNRDQSDQQNNEKTDESKRVREFAMKRYEKAKITEVRPTDDRDGFYVAALTDDDGTRVNFIVNPDGQVFAEQVEMNADQTPTKVKQTIEDLFGGAKIRKIYRTTYTYYQLQMRSASGGNLIVKIRPNGDVIQLITRD